MRVQIAILHCVSGYPAQPDDYNLHTITDMRSRFGLVTGLSDHTLDNTTAIAGVALGASIVEKHITLDRTGGGPDDSFSLEPDDLTQLCAQTRNAWQAMGRATYQQVEAEKGNVRFRRSLYAVVDINAGESINSDNVKSIRPGFGLAPKQWDAIQGKKAVDSIERGTPISWDLITK